MRRGSFCAPFPAQNRRDKFQAFDFEQSDDLLQKSPVSFQIRGVLSDVRHSGELAGHRATGLLPDSGGTDRIRLQMARGTASS